MRIAIVGGGLAGLVVAFRRSEAGDDVTVYEATQRLGGQIATERTGGFVVEHGAEGFVARSDALPALSQSLGLQRDLIDQLTLVSYVFDGRSLERLAPGEAARKLGFQVPSEELGRGVRSFRLGMGQLIETLASELGRRATLRLGHPVQRIEAGPGRFDLERTDGRRETFERVVVATSAGAAAALLEPLVGQVASTLEEAKTLSSLTVSLAYPCLDIDHPLDGSGFVVAEDQQTDGFRACAFVSSKLEGRAPADWSLLRIFFRPDRAALMRDPDALWIARADRCADRALGVKGTAQHAWVSRWPDALPVFDSGRLEAVQAIETALGSIGLCLAGSAFHGAGIDAAVRSAERAASSLGLP